MAPDMSLHRLALAVVLGGSACAVGTDDLPGDDDPRSEVAQVVTSAQLERLPADVCDALPTEGACAAACDRDALADFVPPGACASFYCDLLDGRHLVVHACHPEE